MRLRLALLSACVLGLVLVGWVTTQRPGPEPFTDACHFEVGERLAFNVRYAGTVKIDPGAMLGAPGAGTAPLPTVHTPTTQGQLRWEILEVSPTGARIAGELGAPPAAPLYFGLEIGPDCTFGRVGISGDAPADQVDRLRALLALANVRLGTESSWQTETPDGLGLARLDYRHNNDGTVTRRKTSYISLHRDKRLAAEVENSEGLLVPDPAGRWLRSLVTHEVVRLRFDAQDVTRSDVRLSLYRVAAGAARAAPDLHSLRWVGPQEILARPKAKTAAPTITHLSLDRLLEGIDLHLAAGDRAGALELLMAQLIAQPALRERIANQLRAGIGGTNQRDILLGPTGTGRRTSAGRAGRSRPRGYGPASGVAGPGQDR